jgi:hypothetical protein
MGCLVPYSDMCPTIVQIRGQGGLPGSVLSCPGRMVSDVLLGVCNPRPSMLVNILIA